MKTNELEQAVTKEFNRNINCRKGDYYPKFIPWENTPYKPNNKTPKNKKLNIVCSCGKIHKFIYNEKTPTQEIIMPCKHCDKNLYAILNNH